MPPPWTPSSCSPGVVAGHPFGAADAGTNARELLGAEPPVGLGPPATAYHVTVEFTQEPAKARAAEG